jgi:hypothetical protein
MIVHSKFRQINVAIFRKLIFDNGGLSNVNVKNHLKIPNGPVMLEWDGHLGIKSSGFLASQGAEKRFMGLYKLFCPA